MSFKIAVLVSGSGRSFINLLDQIEAGHLQAEVQVLISTKRVTPAIDAAKANGIPTLFISWKTLGVDEASKEVYKACEGADLIVTAGFLKFLNIQEKWAGRIVNIHPSLLPAHGGAGYYGDRVHQSVLESGDKVSGCTVHLCDSIYDHGAIIDQLEVPVLEDDTVSSLAARVFVQEMILLPQVLQSFVTGLRGLPFKS